MAVLPSEPSPTPHAPFTVHGSTDSCPDLNHLWHNACLGAPAAHVNPQQYHLQQGGQQENASQSPAHQQVARAVVRCAVLAGDERVAGRRT